MNWMQRTSRWLGSLPVLLSVLLVASIQLFAGAIPDTITYWGTKQYQQFGITLAGIVGVLLLALFSLVNREPGSRVLASRAVMTKNDTRRGLVVIVSKYDPRSATINAALPQQSNRTARSEAIDGLIAQALTSRDAAALDLENSNLNQVLRAVKAHWKPASGEDGRLEHVWLLSTAGSSSSAALLALHLRTWPGFMAEVHHAGSLKNLEIPGQDSDNKELISRIKDAAAQLFQEVSRSPLNFKAHELVADVTGGFKTMTVGLTLACLARDRDIQYVSGVASDPPTIYSFDTRLGRGEA